MQCSSTGAEAPGRDNWKRVITTYRDRIHCTTAAAFSVLLGVCSSVVAAEPDNLLGIITKPRPKEMDEWTHLDYDAGGNVVWRNTEVVGKHIGQIIYNEGYLALFGPGGIGAGKDPFTGCIRVDDPKLLWTGAFPTTWNRTDYRIVPSSTPNDILRSDGDLLSLPAGWDQRFAFDPQTTDAELKQKLQTNPPAKH